MPHTNFDWYAVYYIALYFGIVFVFLDRAVRRKPQAKSEIAALALALGVGIGLCLFRYFRP